MSMDNIYINSFSPLNLGLGLFLVEWSFFPENKRNDQERSHCSKKNEGLEHVLKNFGMISKRTERELLEKDG